MCGRSRPVPTTAPKQCERSMLQDSVVLCMSVCAHTHAGRQVLNNWTINYTSL